MLSAQALIDALHLQPHPKEGGYFRETYRSAETFTPGARYAGLRSHSTAIYYLLTPTTFSALHRLHSDEIFHFYLGGKVRMLQLWPDGRTVTHVLGSNLEEGEVVQLMVPRGVWQGSYLESGDFALLGCTVAPGFDFADYQHGDREQLRAAYPREAALIERLTL